MRDGTKVDWDEKLGDELTGTRDHLEILNMCDSGVVLCLTEAGKGMLGLLRSERV